MISRILVANRGEIALRVIRACKELGIETVAIYSEGDKNALYLKYADFTVCIGPAPAAKSYLDISRIISAAEVTDVDAIHPGYGFLSENSHFAEVCRSCNITFIGPNPEASKVTGDKVSALALARKLKIQTIQGSDTAVKDEKEAAVVARRIGYPIILKAAGGGGGRGMRIAHNDVSLAKVLMAAQTEAGAAFKNPNIYLEKYLEGARHIEIQVLGDRFGNVIHLGERDCTIQRRYQKLLEESPSPAMNPSLRKQMGEAAVNFAKAAKYDSAGTVEFLVDKNGRFYFIEMNARIQVEHPVTEMVTGIDLVKEQISIAGGERLRISQKEIELKGCAIEVRINAEDPSNGFKPMPGKIAQFIPPGGPGVRLDTAIYTGYEIPPYYDSLIAKLIVHKKTRSEAIATMRRALAEFIVEGVPTTIPLHQKIFEHSDFVNGQIDLHFIDNYFSK